jgi:hypothetical protein
MAKKKDFDILDTQESRTPLILAVNDSVCPKSSPSFLPDSWLPRAVVENHLGGGK